MTTFRLDPSNISELRRNTLQASISSCSQEPTYCWCCVASSQTSVVPSAYSKSGSRQQQQQQQDDASLAVLLISHWRVKAQFYFRKKLTAVNTDTPQQGNFVAVECWQASCSVEQVLELVHITCSILQQSLTSIAAMQATHNSVSSFCTSLDVQNHLGSQRQALAMAMVLLIARGVYNLHAVCS